MKKLADIKLGLSGVELETIWLVNDRLRLDASIGYLDSSIDSVIGGELLSGTPNSTISITDDNELPYNPEWQVNLGINYSHYFDNGGEIRSRLDYQWVDEQYLSVENRPGSLNDDFYRVNLNASYIPSNADWDISIGVKNLTDEEYSTSGGSLAITASSYVNLSRPREAYVSFRYRFGH